MRAALSPLDPPSPHEQAKTHVRPFLAERRVRARAPRRRARTLRRPGAPRPSPRRRRTRQSQGPALRGRGAAQSPQLAACPLPRSAGPPRVPRAVPLSRTAPAAAAGNILPSAAPPLAHCARRRRLCRLPAPLAPVPAPPIGPRAHAPGPSQSPAPVGAAPTG